MSRNEKTWLDELQENFGDKKINTQSISEYGENFEDYALSKEDNILIQENRKILRKNPNSKIVCQWAEKNGLGIEKLFLLESGLNEFVESVKKLLDQNLISKFEWLNDSFVSKISKLEISSTKTKSGKKNMDLYGFYILLKDIDLNLESAGLKREQDLKDRKITNKPFYMKMMFPGSPIKNILDKENFQDILKQILEKKLSQIHSKKIILGFKERLENIYFFNVKNIE